ncbi:hypothetical protein [Scytonema sp. NUACC26]|uniref:hypothetical protein n=1 Tax=Scytonema sp. NUACC26 TaxID=3140176 RepID=UPI0038B23494
MQLNHYQHQRLHEFNIGNRLALVVHSKLSLLCHRVMDEAVHLMVEDWLQL